MAKKMPPKKKSKKLVDPSGDNKMVKGKMTDPTGDDRFAGAKKKGAGKAPPFGAEMMDTGAGHKAVGKKLPFGGKAKKKTKAKKK